MTGTTTRHNNFNKPAGRIKKYLPGILVKNMRENNLGVLIKEDDFHSDWWQVSCSEGVVSWYEPNFEKVR
jgi:hypothetical protein|tara:strand:+ start:336 stop:545 length:210 start_codon:yes stop_codon:yes gene_type:complete